MLFHKASNLRVGFDLPGSLSGLSPGGVVSQGSPFSSFPGVSSLFGRVTSLLMADEALLVPDVLCFFIWRKVDLVYVHSIRIWSGGSSSWRDVTVSSSSEFPEPYHIPVELSCLVKPLLPLPTSLSIWKGGGSHHDSCYIFFLLAPRPPSLLLTGLPRTPPHSIVLDPPSPRSFLSSPLS